MVSSAWALPTSRHKSEKMEPPTPTPPRMYAGSGAGRHNDDKLIIAMVVVMAI